MATFYISLASARRIKYSISVNRKVAIGSVRDIKSKTCPKGRTTMFKINKDRSSACRSNTFPMIAQKRGTNGYATAKCKAALEYSARISLRSF